MSFSRLKTHWTVSAKDIIIGHGLYVFGGWQSKEMRVVLAWFKKRGALTSDSYIINAGANIGSTSIYLAQNSPCRVLAIEPIPDNFELLVKNVFENDLQDRINCFRAAIHTEAEQLQMATPMDNPGGSEIIKSNSNTFVSEKNCNIKYHYVEGMPLLEVLQKNEVSLKSIAFVWSDTQGAEGHVIRSGQALWQAGIPLVIEFSLSTLRYQGESGFTDLLESNFSGFCKIPSYADASNDLVEFPIQELQRCLMKEGNSDTEHDLLLIP